jgi:glycosyltransferase involved in cell wall biosynthesis
VKHYLVVISLLDGRGPTGVESHFNQLIAEARAASIDCVLVSAYPSQRLWAKLARTMLPAIRLASKEHAEIFSLWINSRIIFGKLAVLLARETRPVTLYAQDPLSACVALKCNHLRRCRVVAVIHYNISQSDEMVSKGEAQVGSPLWRFLAAAEMTSLPHVDRIIFVSRFMQNEIARRLPATSAVPQSVIPNFAGRIAINDSVSPCGKDMIAIGTLEPRKNQAFLFHVLARARSRGFFYTLTVVGDGPDHAMLIALAQRLGLQDQVTFAGFQKNAVHLIPQHRLLVHAAVIENMPITLIEALGVGRPILAAAVGGIAEIFSDGVEGYYWPLDDIDAAAEVLIKTLSDVDTYRHLAQNALKRYEQAFHFNQLGDRWLAAILGQRQPEVEVAQ